MKLVISASLAFLGCMTPNASAAQTGPTPAAPPPSEMERDALEAEVTRARAIIQGGAVVARRPAGCTSAESRQFDFWLGEWDVSPGQSSVIVAESVITLHDQGCVILENWRPFRDAHGHSINAYDAANQSWRQTWVDASGTITQYVGARDAEGVIRLDNLGAGPGDRPPTERRRMNFARIDENTVRQWGELYEEAAQSWTTEWAFIYRRRGASGRQP